MKDRDKRWQSIDEFLEHLTYNPPPVLSQQHPAAETVAGDEPTVRFRRTTPYAEPVSDRGAADHRSKPVAAPNAAAHRSDHDTSPNAAHRRVPTRRPGGRRTVLQGLALLVPLVIAIGAWYVLLSGRSGPSRSERSGDLTASTGAVALDSPRVSGRGTVSPRDTTTQTPAPPPSSAEPKRRTPTTTSPKRQPVEPGGATRTIDAANPRCASALMADQRACLLSHIARNDTTLQRVYDALIAELRRSASVRRGEPDPPAVTRLRVEQRAWVVARDRECTRAPAPGSVRYWAQPLAECFARVSTAREKELNETLRRARQSSR